MTRRDWLLIVGVGAPIAALLGYAGLRWRRRATVVDRSYALGVKFLALQQAMSRAIAAPGLTAADRRAGKTVEAELRDYVLETLDLGMRAKRGEQYATDRLVMILPLFEQALDQALAGFGPEVPARVANVVRAEMRLMPTGSWRPLRLRIERLGVRIEND